MQFCAIHIRAYCISRTSGAQHQQIADSFISNITSALQELNPTLTYEYCNDLAWGTLQGTPAFFSDTYLTETEKERIGKERTAERDNAQIGIYTPKGNPCNK